MPALVSTLCICIVFVPMFFLTGVARYLFAPLAEAVVFAMLASYVLSRTLVPTLVMLLMDHAPAACAAHGPSLLQRVYRAFDARFEQLRGGYIVILAAVLDRRRLFAGAFLGFCVLSCALVFILGRDFFPSVDAGQIRLHMRLPTGTRIEETARVADQVEAAIRTHHSGRRTRHGARQSGRADQRHQQLLQQCGRLRHHSMARFRSRSTKDIAPTRDYIEEMRRELPRRFPGRGVLLSAGRHGDADPEFRAAGRHRRAVHRRRPARQLPASPRKLMKQIQMIPGTVDTHIHQRLDLPTVALQMDRTQLQQLGLSPNDVTRTCWCRRPAPRRPRRLSG